MEQLLTGLLDYSSMSQDELRPEPVKLKKVLFDALTILEADISAKHAVITVEDSPHIVSAHPATTVAITANLISNALKFMPPDIQPQIRIWTEEVRNTPSDEAAASTPYIRLSIQDNGIGIDQKYLDKIFGVFERLHGKEKYPGSGLGLAIVKKGAERMGGRVGVQSELNKGSHFWIDLPKASGSWLE